MPQPINPPMPNSIASRLIMNGILKYTVVSDLRMDNRGPFLKVEAELYYVSHHEDVIYYRFRWYDDSGMSTGSEEAWKTIPVRSKARQGIIGVSTSKTASNFMLELQSPNNTGENP
jgi:uncharacterized protein YcfL